MEDSQKEEADSQSISSEEWQDLSKSEYAKVIFTELCHDTDSGCVRCKFHITDEVQSDPSDFVGLYRVGYEDLNQCIVVRELSQIKAETESNLYSCIFECEELPELEEGFYQFLYVRAKDEICGASMPFEIKDRKLNPYHSNQRCVLEQLSTEDGDFLMVKTQVEKQNEALWAELQALKETLAEELIKKGELQNQVVQLADEKQCLRALYEDQLKKVTEGKQQLHAQYDADIQKVKCELRSVRELSLAQMQEKDKFAYELQGQVQVLQRAERQLQDEILVLRNKIREAEVCMSRLVCNDQVKSLSEQLEDQKCMVRALDHSKQMAIKEIASLTATLTHRTDSLNRMKHECASAKEQLNKAEEQNEKILQDKSQIEKTLAEAKELFQKTALALEISSMNVAALNNKYENEKKLLEEAIASITKLTKESSDKNELIENLKSNLEKRNACLNDQVNELMSRLEEASHIYQQQFKQIKQLKRSAQKLQISSQASTPRLSVSSSRSHVSNDSDTGEHNADRYPTAFKIAPLEDATKVDVIATPPTEVISETELRHSCWKKKIVKIATVDAQQEDVDTLPPLIPVENQLSQSSVEEPVQVGVKLDKPNLSERKEVPMPFLENVEKEVTKSIADDPIKCNKMESQTAQCISDNNNLYPSLVTVCDDAEDKKTEGKNLVCPFCPAAFPVNESGSPPVAFFDHLDGMHRLRMCPFCGHLFDTTVPDRYLQLHVQHHHAEPKRNKKI